MFWRRSHSASPPRPAPGVPRSGGAKGGAPRGERLSSGLSGAEAASSAGGVNVLPTIALVQQLLDEFGLKHGLDGDGDLVVRWEKCSVFFFCYGERKEVLQARMYLNRRFEVDARGALALLMDEWNRTKLFPKAYTVLPDDGMVGICGEQCHDFEAGVNRAQLKYTIGVWIDTLLRFCDWVDEQV